MALTELVTVCIVKMIHVTTSEKKEVHGEVSMVVEYSAPKHKRHSPESLKQSGKDGIKNNDPMGPRCQKISNYMMRLTSSKR